ncbi:MAG: YfhO family protein [Elusimicrobia bacterium]|nr:YfhO family protein [Elusimicrobiota bacterium]
MKPADVRPWLWPAALSAFFLVPALAGRTFFWGDLLYIHFPWRALAAQELARGHAPLWDPFVYLGMPLAAEMQGAAWYPGTLPFHVFGFETALSMYHAFHYGLAAFLTFCWLRRLRLAAPAALAGAAAWAGCGVLASRVPFLNHLSTLALLPGLLLFSEEPWLFGLTAALAFLSGYPLMLAGGAAAAFLFSWLLRRKIPAVGAWAGAVAYAAGLGAVLLVPAIELAAGSHRGSGMPLDEVLAFGLEPKDLGGLLAPWFSSAGLDAATQWWRSWWLGLAASAAAAAGLARLRPGLRWPLAAYGAAVIVLALGGSNPVSVWCWRHLPVLRAVRYPGNLTYLLLPAAALAVAAGVGTGRRAGAWAALIAAELALYASLSQPTALKPFFTDPGPLARTLQRELGGERYLLSPRALEWTQGAGANREAAAFDLKHRFYGLTNVPYRAAAVAGFGEPLVPQANYEVMDFLFTRPNMAEAARYLPWVGASVLLTRERYPEGTLRYLGQSLWHGYRSPSPVSGAFWLPDDAASRIPAGLEAGLPPLTAARPVPYLREPGRVSVVGETPPGWLYLAEPRYPGWEARVDGARVTPEPAWGAFQKIRVPGGSWSVDLAYAPMSFSIGLLLSALVVSASAAYWYNRARSL